MWLLMVGKTKPANVIHHQRERSPEALEGGPPVRCLIKIRLPGTEQDGVHRDEKVTTVKCLPNLPSKQKSQSITPAGSRLSGGIPATSCPAALREPPPEAPNMVSSVLYSKSGFPPALHHCYSPSLPRLSYKLLLDHYRGVSVLELTLLPP